MRRVLLLHYTPHRNAVRLTTAQHLDALRAARNAEVLIYNAVNGAPAWLRHLHFDAVVLHTTLLCMRWNVWFERWKGRLEWVSELDATKIAFPQDEYDHAHTLDDWLSELGVTVVCTVLDDAQRDVLYPRLHRTAAFYEVLTGYVDRDFARRAERPRPAERRFDVVYRARHLPYWFGSHGQLKHRIGDEVLARAGRHALRCDISTRATETFLGRSWLDFLVQGRATVGIESGVSTLDRHGELRERVTELLRENPSLSFEEVARRMPPGWDDFRFFAISPRHLEAVATGTAQILVEGRYSGVLEPERHYVPVRRDFSDLDAALERLRDTAALERMAAAAYRDVVESGRYDATALTRTLEEVLERHASARGGPVDRAYRLARRAARAEEEVERVALTPVANVARVGRAGVREMAAGLRHVVTDPVAGRLLADYLRASDMREHVSPRQALQDLLCLTALRRSGSRDGAFRVAAELDVERRRLLVRSLPPAAADGSRPSRDEVSRLLRGGAVDVAWDHSQVGRELSFPIAAGRALIIELPAGPHPLPVLNWLARKHPERVLAALDPLFARR